jgi:hypothetical protein
MPSQWASNERISDSGASKKFAGFFEQQFSKIGESQPRSLTIYAYN